MSRQKLKYATNQQMLLDIRPQAAHNIPPEASRLSFNSIVPVNEANCFNIKFVHQPSSTARVATQRTLNTTHFRIFMSNGFEKYKFYSMLPVFIDSTALRKVDRGLIKWAKPIYYLFLCIALTREN